MVAEALTFHAGDQVELIDNVPGRRELDRLQAQARQLGAVAGAPVVRSLPHMPGPR